MEWNRGTFSRTQRLIRRNIHCIFSGGHWTEQEWAFNDPPQIQNETQRPPNEKEELKGVLISAVAE